MHTTPLIENAFGRRPVQLQVLPTRSSAADWPTALGMLVLIAVILLNLV